MPPAHCVLLSAYADAIDAFAAIITRLRHAATAAADAFVRCRYAAATDATMILRHAVFMPPLIFSAAAIAMPPLRRYAIRLLRWRLHVATPIRYCLRCFRQICR